MMLKRGLIEGQGGEAPPCLQCGVLLLSPNSALGC